MSTQFKIRSEYQPGGDQPKAIRALTEGLNQGKRDQVLMGITGSGKTFTMANVIVQANKPALIMAHNKTLAAQIYQEMKEIFPDNAVEYFVSYYDYYQPEAYVPRTDTYIEKDSSINDQIDLLRHSATRSLLERRDVIVVSSVSCIYGLGSPELYSKMVLYLKQGMSYTYEHLLIELVNLQYERNDINFVRGTFRVRGDSIDVFPVHYSEKAWRLSMTGNILEAIYEFDPLTGEKLFQLTQVVIYAKSHFVTPKPVIDRAITGIKQELSERIGYFRDNGKLLEAQRIQQRTEHDLEMLMATGSCKGIENYSRYLTGSAAGDPPPTLFAYLPNDALLFIDESHVMVPQIRAMYNGDKARKQVLVDYGFRLPSALDNRPLKFDEWQHFRPQTVFVSATPGEFELVESKGAMVEQIIRPTGLLDPICIVRPAATQVEDLILEITKVVAEAERVLVTTMTKKMAEDLTEYLKEKGIKAQYLHSEVHTLDRIEVIRNLRQGKIEVLVGINLLREGLDIPECSLVAILDADKEGFLRSEVSLIQTIGRAARNSQGRVILYADHITKSMKIAINETARRRQIQEEYNQRTGIKPITINRKIGGSMALERLKMQAGEEAELLQDAKKLESHLKKLRKEMLQYASEMEFEKAAHIRDKITAINEARVKLTD